MKNFLSFCVILFFGINVYGQQQQGVLIRGQLVDSITKAPVASATIHVQTTPGHTSIKAKTNDDGTFTIKSFFTDSTEIAFSALAFEAKKVFLKTITSVNGEVDLGLIMLIPKRINLKEVQIIRQKPLIRQEVDRIIYDVQADPEKSTLTMLDMLRKVPLISVSAEDQVLIKGKDNFKVLINGKPSALVVGNPRDVFKILPARLVKSIEVITIPPPKYDGEGLGGILNVVMDRKVLQGHIGGISSGIGRQNSSANLNFALRAGKYTFSTVLGSFFEYPPISQSSSIMENYQIDTNKTIQDGNIENKNRTHFASLSFGYEIDSLNLLMITTGVKRGENKLNNNYSTSILDSYNTSSFNTLSLFNTKKNGYSIDINLEHTFKRNKNRALTFSANYNNLKNNQFGQNVYSDIRNFSRGDFNQSNNSNSEEKTLQIDYSHIKKTTEVSVGSKIILRSGNSESFTFLAIDDYDSKEAADKFQNDQKIYALYNSYNIKIKDWGIVAGIRYEHTINKAVFFSDGTFLDQKYNNLIPSIALMRKLKTASSINIGYTQRLQRPDISIMNPFVNKSDPTFYFTGNPDLLPVRIHSVNLAYSWFKKGFLNVSAGYSLSNNTIQRVTEIGLDSINYSSYENIGRNKIGDFSVNINYPLTKKLTISANGSASYVDISGTINGSTYTNNGFQGNIYSYINYSLKNDLRVSANFGFYSPTIILQGLSNGYFYSSFSVNKPFLKRKLNASVSISNPFQKFRTVENKISTADFDQNHRYRNYFRNYSFNLSYNFGKLDKPVKRVKKSIKNDDIIESTGKYEKGSKN